ncbi:hypothetical protein [Paenibacillus hamazuiensis]|uniref:hypothetical protein n=1 Tax=Paenibacillus hamazuiensis TaxID=2936508 RepID=UPI002010BF52|nr:hypothetical protein [Paenibacillus hamazuiensis]
MTEGTKKGQVKFKQPPVKLVADMPEDEEMRGHLEEMRQNDGFPGSCGIIGANAQDGEQRTT